AAKAALEQAQKEHQETTVDAVASGLGNSAQQVRNDLEKGLGQPVETLSVTDLDGRLKELQSLGGRARLGLKALGRESRRHIVVSMLAALVLLGLGAIAYRLFGQLAAGLGTLTVSSLIAVAIAVVRLTNATLKAANQLIDSERLRQLR